MVVDAGLDSGSLAMMASSIAVARAMDMEVTAEGVETKPRPTGPHRGLRPHSGLVLLQGASRGEIRCASTKSASANGGRKTHWEHNMDMSDKIVADEADELERDRERCRRRRRQPSGRGFGHLAGFARPQAQADVRRAAAAAVLLRSVALFALVDSDGAIDGQLMYDVR
jgi:hypothetical protein